MDSLSMFLDQATFWLCLVLFLRLFTFQRGALRFRRNISFLAWVTMAGSAAAVIYIATGKLTLPAAAWPLVLILAVFTWLVWRAKGNLAAVLRPAAGWNGIDRRKERGSPDASPPP